MRLVELGLSVVGILLVLGLSPPAQASDRAALARLQRIARGQWQPLVAPVAPVPFATEIRKAARQHGLFGLAAGGTRAHGERLRPEGGVRRRGAGTGAS